MQKSELSTSMFVSALGLSGPRSYADYCLSVDSSLDLLVGASSSRRCRRSLGGAFKVTLHSSWTSRLTLELDIFFLQAASVHRLNGCLWTL